MNQASAAAGTAQMKTPCMACVIAKNTSCLTAAGSESTVAAHDGNPALIPKPGDVQAHLLDLLDVDISRPRWLTQ